MKVWIITIGEPLPCDPGEQRLLRSGILAGILSEAGHDVTWWSSTFDHMLKTHRATEPVEHRIHPGFRLKLLHSVAYRRNLSLQRIVNHREVAAQFARMAPLEARPDVILCSFPTIELSDMATRFGAKHDVPVVLDVRDQWPDVFLDLMPRGCRWLGRLVFEPLFQATRNAFRRATAITGVTQQFIDWGLRYAGRPSGVFDVTFPMAYPDQQPPAAAIAAAQQFWKEQGVPGHAECVVCYFGTLGRLRELDTVIDAARLLERERVLFVLCGAGDMEAHYKDLAAGCPNVMFPGWMNASQIWALMRIASLGLAPYPSAPNYTENVPNKPLEYLSAGLPIISSLQGKLAQLLAEHDCGLTYRNNDANDLASSIMRLKNDPAALARMSANALNTYRLHFKAEDVYRRMGEYLEMIAGGKSA